VIWSTLTSVTSIPSMEEFALCISVIVIVGLGTMYLKSVRGARRDVAALDHREEHHKVALALAAQNIVRHDQEALAAEMSERRRAEASLSHAAYHDRLTGAYNRSYFLHQVRNALERKIPRTGMQKAVVYVDIDGFKAINDTMGQKFGDLLIREVSQRLAVCTREGDTLARMGGDEFAILLEDLSDEKQAWRISQRMLSILEEPALLADINLTITASIGLCVVEETYLEAEEVLRDADIAMHQAKRQGGGRCVQYVGSMRSEAFAMLQLKRQLRIAVTNEEFVNFYMPLVDMTNGRIYGVEALVRWNHPIRGLLAPGEFIQLAEESDIILGIGSYVLRQACIQFQEFIKHANGEMILSVNISSRQLDHECFLAQLSSVIKETGIRPQSLQLELLESVLIANAERMGLLFIKIRELGVKIAFDDFGTGYSSLSYLARYPIDTLKIDQSFVKNMKKGSVNADIVQLVIKLARTIGMEVSAEGVEEPEQAADLVEYGCRVAQGYLYSRPVSAEEITALIARGAIHR
jgi:diguanylate cyclase (GGDEF)-like protein